MLICTKNLSARDNSITEIEFQEAETVSVVDVSFYVSPIWKKELWIGKSERVVPLTDSMEVAIYGGGVLVAVFKKGECIYLAQDQQFPTLEVE